MRGSDWVNRVGVPSRVTRVRTEQLKAALRPPPAYKGELFLPPLVHSLTRSVAVVQSQWLAFGPSVPSSSPRIAGALERAPHAGFAGLAGPGWLSGFRLVGYVKVTPKTDLVSTIMFIPSGERTCFPAMLSASKWTLEM